MFAIARDKVWIEYIMRYGRRSYILLVSAHTEISIWEKNVWWVIAVMSLKMCHKRSLHQGGICYTDPDTVTLTFKFTVTFNSLFFFTYWHNLTSLQQQTVEEEIWKFYIWNLELLTSCIFFRKSGKEENIVILYLIIIFDLILFKIYYLTNTSWNKNTLCIIHYILLK